MLPRGKAAKPDSSSVYAARQSYVADGEHRARKGTRVSGDDPRVQAHPGLWVLADGLTDAELKRAIREANARTRQAS